MQDLCLEIDNVVNQGFKLKFDYPDKQQIEHIAKVHRDMTDEKRSDEEKKLDNFREILYCDD